jgi:N-acetylglucosaminyldiphosphoundecaprenol N-acetyl-beta-D-mannosaminyltransferase
MIFNKLLTDPKDVVLKVLESIEREESLLLTYFNQHCFNVYNCNEDYKKLLDTKFDVYQADFGVYLALKYLWQRKVKRIDATAMNEKILNELSNKNMPFVIVGGNFDEKFIKEESKKRRINLTGYINGYFDESQAVNIIQELKDFGNQIIILGMGVPKQELFAEKLVKTIEAKVIICVGNFIEFYFGTKKRAPVFIQKIGLEWMFRLITEPERLWKRYLIGIPVFVFRILKLKFGHENL